MANEFKCEGYRAADSTVRVSVRRPGVGWAAAASHVLTESEAVALVKAINDALAEAYQQSAE